MKKIISIVTALILVPSITAVSIYKNTKPSDEEEIHTINNESMRSATERYSEVIYDFEESAITTVDVYKNAEDSEEVETHVTEIIPEQCCPECIENFEEQMLEEKRQKVIDNLSYLKFIDGEETDIDDDQIEHIIATGEKTGIDPHLISTIIYSESRGHSDVFNGIYRGYGQIGYDGGRLVYEDILELGEYDHDMAFDPYLNITFIGYILDYLMYHYNYNIYQAIQHYSGTKGEEWYLDYTSNKLNQIGGPTLDEIEQEWRENYKQRESES